MRFLWRLVAVVIVLVSSAWLAHLEPAPNASRSRHNQFDPIYAFDDDSDVHIVSAGPSPPPSASTQPRVADRQKWARQTFDSRQQPGHRQLVRVVDTFQAPVTNLSPVASNTPTFGSGATAELPGRAKKDDQRQPHHWSALENYYHKLRQPVLTRFQEPVAELTGGAYPPAPVYQLIQQEIDNSLNSYKPINSFSPDSPLGLRVLHSVNSAPPAKGQAAFLLPIVGTSSSSQAPTSGSSDSDFGVSVHQQSAPGISRAGGRGVVILGNRASSNRLSGPLASVEGDKVKYLEWRKLPELLQIQQQQQRVKHQQETFGPWYDHQRTREQLQEEAFCGPRNYVNFHLAPSATAVSARPTNQEAKSPVVVQSPPSPIQWSRLQLRIDQRDPAIGVSQLDVPVALSAGEYPSHMGVYYNGSTSDSDFLCAATWIHESFALTLASCVKSMDTKRLLVRAGEWNLNRNTSSVNASGERPPLITREVEQVSIFPKYGADSVEHNLALIRFTRPIDYLEVPYICPACQMQSRASIRSSSCWTPVRNVTSSEYFDAEGEGETKEKRVASMIELPVRLVANDENDCYRQTKVEFFNFQHPNYICSADYRRADWRARLNQTDYFGSGIYCNEGGNLSLVSILHPIHPNSSSAFGYMDLSYYRPWMRKVISGHNF